MPLVNRLMAGVINHDVFSKQGYSHFLLPPSFV